MTTTVFNTRPLSPTTSSVVMVVHLDRFLHLATRYALEKAAAQRRADSLSRKQMLSPASMKDARARTNEADYEEVLASVGSAAAAKLFRAPKLVKPHSIKKETSWKAKKAQCQWAGCPKSIRTKRDMRLAVKRRQLREKQLSIPDWDVRMSAALHR